MFCLSSRAAETAGTLGRGQRILVPWQRSRQGIEVSVQGGGEYGNFRGTEKSGTGEHGGDGSV